MKRTLIFIISVILALNFSIPAFAQSQQNISVFIDGLPVSFNVQPIIIDGRTLVPFRAIAEALNVRVNWDGSTQTIDAVDSETSVHLQIGSNTAYIVGSPVTLDVAPQIYGGSTMIPLRFFSEAYKCKVTFDNTTGQINITSPPKQMAVIGFYALGDSKTSSWTNLFGMPYPESSTGNTDAVGELALGWYSLDKDGNLLTKSRTGWQRPDDWENVLETARKYSIKTEMVVHVADGDGTLSSMLSNESAYENAADSIAEEVKLYGGVNLDFEGLGYSGNSEQLKSVQDSFTSFVNLLSQKLRASGIRLTLTLHAPNSAYKGYDYKSLGEAADRIIVMAYGYGQTPEPVNSVLQAVKASISSVPADKLVLGISAPSETPQSILTKVGIAKRYGLKGIAIWRLGLVTPEMWDALRTTVIPIR